MSDNRFGIKEVADVWFYELNEDGTKGEPVLCLDTLKVSNIEQSADSVDAKGGKGDAPLIIWDYNKEINITLEDALLSDTSLEMVYGKDEDGIITISANTFPGVYYVIGRTFARDMKTGKDRLFSFVIPKAKIMSENTIAMEAEGDPTVFNMSLRALRDKDGKMVKLVMGVGEDDIRVKEAMSLGGPVKAIAGFDESVNKYENVDIDLVIPEEIDGEKVQYIDNAFSQDKRITSLTINSIDFATIEFDDSSFQGSDNLSELKIGHNLSFYDYTGLRFLGPLKNIECDEKNSSLYVKDNCLVNKNGFGGATVCRVGTKFQLPTDVSIIGQAAFSTLPDLTELTIPESYTSLRTGIVYNCPNLVSLEVEEGNKTYKSINNCIINKSNRSLVQGCINSIIPEDAEVVTSLFGAAFWGCYNLNQITIPSNIETIEHGFDPTFIDCPNLTDIYLPGHTEGSIAGAPWGAVNATIHWNEEAPK